MSSGSLLLVPSRPTPFVRHADTTPVIALPVATLTAASAPRPSLRRFGSAPRWAARLLVVALALGAPGLAFAGQLISQVGNWLTSIALTLLVLHRTHSGLAIGVLGACQFGPILLLGPWAGLLADRYVAAAYSAWSTTGGEGPFVP